MMLTAPNLDALAHIRHGFFTRQDGVSQGIYQSLNCGWGSGDRQQDIAANRQLVAAQLGIEPDHLITARQIHSAKAVMVNAPQDNTFTADGLMTTQKHLAVAVLAADCAPILLADRRAPICAALHAGWRGALSGITDATIAQMKQSGAQEIIAAIGPHISAAVYQTRQDMRDEACALDPDAQKFFTPQDDYFYFDLGGYLEARLVACSVGEIFRFAHCTLSEPDLFFSYRASRARNEPSYGRQISAILLS